MPSSLGNCILREGLDGHEGDGERGRIHWKGKEAGEDKGHMIFLSNVLPYMKSCAGNKEEAEDEEGMTDKTEAAETDLNKFFGRKMAKKERKKRTYLCMVLPSQILYNVTAGEEEQIFR